MKDYQIYTKVIVQAWELLSLDEVKYWGSGVGICIWKPQTGGGGDSFKRSQTRWRGQIIKFPLGDVLNASTLIIFRFLKLGCE